MTNLTICICTLDRAATLEKGLETLLCNTDLESVEIIVVNNGMEETTRYIVERYISSLPIRYVRHNKPGLGEARNRGWQEATADWIAYIDDDSLVYPTWLKAALDSIRTVEEKCFGIAGNVDSGNPPVRLPEWYHPKLAESVFSNVNYGNHSHYLSFPEVPLGNNMIWKKSLLSKIGGFSPLLRTQDEVFVGWMGYWYEGSCFFCAEMKVSHPPTIDRLTKKWALNKSRSSGRDHQTLLTLMRNFPFCPPRFSFLLRIPSITLKLLVSFLSGNQQQTMAFSAMLWFEIGRFEYWAMAKRSEEYSLYKEN